MLGPCKATVPSWAKVLVMSSLLVMQLTLCPSVVMMAAPMLVVNSYLKRLVSLASASVMLILLVLLELPYPDLRHGPGQ